MAKQNIYDNEIFFENYRKLRKNAGNANDVFEIPALLSLLPDLCGKKVLDLGCGFGEHCRLLADMGAASITGIDISEKMLDIARRENSSPKTEYINMPMEELNRLDGEYDLAVSSLALHYVEDLDGVVKNIRSLLTDGGLFVFSQENPICTSYSGGDRWTRDENGSKLYLNLKDYSVEGMRSTQWFVDNVQKYHRMFSTIVNILAQNGFVIEKMIEPVPTKEILEKFPKYEDLRHKPDFLLVRAKKQ